MPRVSQLIYNAIKFYAEPGNWTKDPESGLDIPEAPAFLDAGTVAKEIIALIERSPASQPMTLAQALQINECLVRLALYGEGLVETVHAMEASTVLKDISLDDMLEARSIVNAVNQLPVATGETKTLNVVCDPRLIAGIYCTLRYTPGSVIVQTANCALCMVREPDPEDDPPPLEGETLTGKKINQRKVN